MKIETRSYAVPGISCDHCKRAIEEHVGAVAGVEGVDVDVDTRIVTVSGGDPGAVEAAINDAGYSVA